MKEESKHIKLPLGNISMEETLGSYYIDMRPAKIHYTNNIYGGKFDENGVPMIKLTNGKHGYFPINVAQYAFMLHAEWLENPSDELYDKLNQCLNVLEELKTEESGYAVWWHHHYEVKYKISPPWASAMAQGEIISFYLRMYQVTQDEMLLNSAMKAYQFMKLDVTEGGVRRYDNTGHLWLEEYPSTPASYVLNGFIYAVFGLFDLYRVTKDEEVKSDLDACIITLKENISKFDCGYWSIYDLYKRELVRYYYQRNVHVPQLDVLFRLTNEKVFLKYKNKWERTLNPLNYGLVKIMYRVLPRWRKLKK